MVMRPLVPEELLERCDLAGEAEVLDVIPRPSGGTVAKLHFTKIVKGSVQRAAKEKRNVAVVKLRGTQSGPTGELMLGSWSDDYEPGTFVFTHLSWDIATNLYETSWWNAITWVGREPRR